MQLGPLEICGLKNPFCDFWVTEETVSRTVFRTRTRVKLGRLVSRADGDGRSPRIWREFNILPACTRDVAEAHPW
jgi:hypothetical protein